MVGDYDGERYLVAMLGEDANWVANVRAADGPAVLQHGRREAVRLEEVDPGIRAPILRRYLEVAPGHARMSRRIAAPRPAISNGLPRTTRSSASSRLPGDAAMPR